MRFKGLDKKQPHIILSPSLVNALLLKVRPKLYQSRYYQSAIQVNQDTTHLALMPHKDTSVAFQYYSGYEYQKEHDPRGYIRIP